MAVTESRETRTLIAGEDLSSHQFRFVTLSLMVKSIKLMQQVSVASVSSRTTQQQVAKLLLLSLVKHASYVAVLSLQVHKFKQTMQGKLSQQPLVTCLWAMLWKQVLTVK